ncbi:MAG: hypothetical protein HKO65_04505 [Gemmatimonadetes bacterium]|nr:hypothetical protein [Gemmatimonadota bacterium]NNM04341.1 hypothetical protein [Gemmatimonadota bacterium]
MDRMRAFMVSAALCALLACEPPTTAPALDSGSETGPPTGLAMESNGLVPITYPFMPYPDGYQFKNFGGAGDWMLFSEVFGGTVNIWSPMDWDYYVNSFLPGFGGGQCYGFAITAGMFYRNTVHPSFYQRGASHTFEIPQITRGGGDLSLDEEIERHIEKHWFMWRAKEIKPHRVWAKNIEEAAEIIDLVEAELKAGWQDPWVLSFWTPSVAHTVNIVGMERTDDGAMFRIWDNNTPYRDETNSPGWREFQFGPDGFTYGTREITRIAIDRISPNELAHIRKWWGDVDFDEFWVWVSRVIDPDMFAIHIDELGRRLGSTASAEFDEIPEASRLRYPAGLPDADWLEPTEYHLPPGDYTVQLSNPNTGALDYRLFAGDALFAMNAVGQTPSSVRITSLQEARAFTLDPESILESAEVRLVRVLSAEEERALDVTDLSLPINASLSLASVDGARAFEVRLSGMDASLTGLMLTEASPAGPISLVLPTIDLIDGATMQVEPWDWTRLTSMPVFNRTYLGDGQVVLRAHHATFQNFRQLLEDMVASGAIPVPGIANSLRRQMERAPIRALINHLESLVAEGSITGGVADLILAAAEAAKGGGASAGRAMR